MKKSLITTSILLVGFSSSIFAQNIDELVQKVYNNNLTLKTLEKSLSVIKEDIKITTKWKNPMVSIGATDLQFDNITKRDNEPMQAQFIGFSQVFPLGDKLNTKKDIETNNLRITKLKIEDKKLEYKAMIYEYLYSIALLKEKRKHFEKFKENIQKLNLLIEKLYSYNMATQVDILNTQIIYEDLNLKIKKLNRTINNKIIKLEEISYEKINSFNLDTNIRLVRLNKDIKKHPRLKIVKESIKQFENISKYEKEKENSDLTVNLAYFQRDEKYKDYMNFSLSMPISIYGTENLKARKAKFKTIELNHKYEDIKKLFETKVKSLEQLMNDSKETYSVLTKKILPKFDSLEEILENYNSTNNLKNINTKSIIENLNNKIKYQLMAIEEKEKYFSAYSKVKYFTWAKR